MIVNGHYIRRNRDEGKIEVVGGTGIRTRIKRGSGAVQKAMHFARMQVTSTVTTAQMGEEIANPPIDELSPMDEALEAYVSP